MEMADTQDLGSCSSRSMGSSPIADIGIIACMVLAFGLLIGGSCMFVRKPNPHTPTGFKESGYYGDGDY